MNRKWTLLVASTFLMYLSAAGQTTAGSSRTSMQTARADYLAQREAAVQINELAGHLRSPNDARKLVDMVAAVFAKELPPEWATASLRDRIARAEYQTATDPARLIPEPRIAEAWNRYVQAIGAPQEALVTVAEIHNLRDGSSAAAQYMWRRGSQDVWTMPNIDAVGPDGKVAGGCRALETIRIVWDMANHFDNLRSARVRVREGTLASDEFRKWQEMSAPGHSRSSVVVLTQSHNPVLETEMRYVQEHGMLGLGSAVMRLMEDLFPQ